MDFLTQSGRDQPVLQMDSEEYCHRPARSGPAWFLAFSNTETTRVPKRHRMDRPQRDRPAEGLPHLGVLTEFLFLRLKDKNQKEER